MASPRQSEEDYRFLERSLTALRHVTRAFDADLRASDAGRLAIVSSTALARPLAGGANYAAVKAASEAWTRAVAQGFAKAARDAGAPLAAASVVFRVKALDGLEQTLADAFADLWAQDAAAVNDTVVDLSTKADRGSKAAATSWKPQLAALEKAGHRVIAFNRRGHSDSEVGPATRPTSSSRRRSTNWFAASSARTPCRD